MKKNKLKRIVSLVLILSMIISCFSNISVAKAESTKDFFTYEYENQTLNYKVINDPSVGEVGTVEVTNPKPGSDQYFTGDVIIPSTVTNNGTSYKVTRIGRSAFIYNHGLTNVYIPESVTSLGEYAFGFSDDLISIDIPKSVTSIEMFAFVSCISLESIDIPEGIEKIHPMTFYNCNKLVSVNLPKGLKSIEGSAFHACSNLKYINIPEGLTSIETTAFGYCNFDNFTIPEGITKIENNTFVACERLTNVYIRDISCARFCHL